MKKILIGLLALSSLTFAAPVTGTEDPATNTPVFSKGQEGKLKITATLTATPEEVVKYVIFTSADGTLNGAEDTLVLPDLIVSLTKKDMVFDGVPNKIYVKRLSEEGGILPLTDADKPILKPTGITYPTHSGDRIEEGTYCVYPVLSFIASDRLISLVSEIYPTATDIKVNEHGEPVFTYEGANKVVRFPRQYKVSQDIKGEFIFGLGDMGYFNQVDIPLIQKFVDHLDVEPLVGTVYFNLEI